MNEISNWEIVGQIGNVVTGIAAAFAAWHAWRSLSAWRQEMIGQRQAQIAEQVLAAFYQVQDVFHNARSPISFGPALKSDDGADEQATNKAEYGPYTRLRQQSEFFGRFQALKYEYAAQFGAQAAEPFNEIIRIYNEIVMACDDLLRWSNEPEFPVDDEDREYLNQQRRTVFRRSKDDTIGKRIDEQVQIVENVCRPAIEARAKFK